MVRRNSDMSVDDLLLRAMNDDAGQLKIREREYVSLADEHLVLVALGQFNAARNEVVRTGHRLIADRLGLSLHYDQNAGCVAVPAVKPNRKIIIAHNMDHST